MAINIRTALAENAIHISHSKALEFVAAALGPACLKTASAKRTLTVNDTIRFDSCSPILRIFDEAKARDFYCGFLGFEVSFEHRFEPSLPLYMGIERAGLQLHLPEHHGDGSPGSTVFVSMVGIGSYHLELTAKKYSHSRPGLEDYPWGKQLEVIDRFGNRIRFCEDEM